MSDPRLTAAQVAFRKALEIEYKTSRDAMDVDAYIAYLLPYLLAVHETLTTVLRLDISRLTADLQDCRARGAAQWTDQIARLTAENAALREERDRETDEFVFAADESERVRLEAERDALKTELLRPLAWREGATIEKAERELAEARAEMARLQQAMAWQPIETAPKDGTPILAWSRMSERAEVVQWEDPGDGQFGWRYIGEYSFGAELWMPLPAPPAETKDCKPFEDWRGANEDGRKEKG